MKSLSLHSSGLRAYGVLADSVNDASSTRKVYLLAGGLALLGIALLVITIWFWRSTRPEPELLAPLEIMGDRKFRRLDPVAQLDLLDSVRPDDAQPLRWGVVEGEPIREPVIDLVAAARSDLLGFDDLRDPNPVPSADDVESSDAEPAEVAGVPDAVDESVAVAEPDHVAEADEPDERDEPVEPVQPNEPDDFAHEFVADAFEVEPASEVPATPLASELMDPLLRNRKNRNG